MRAVLVSALALLAGSASAEASGPVLKVIQLLEELKTKVSNDLAVETKYMEEYTNFCDDEQSEKGYAIKTAASAIEEFQAAIEDSQGQIQAYDSEIETVGAESAEKKKQLDSATALRKNENADFVAAEKELVDTVDTLSRAIVIIKREMSFIQIKGAKKSVSLKEKLSGLTSALDKLIDAAWIDSGSRKNLKSFLEAEDGDELSLKQPQAIVKNYESKSGGIVETLEEMKDKAEEALHKLQKEEMNAKHAYELLAQSLSDSLTQLKKQADETLGRKAVATEALGKAEGDLAQTSAAKAADEKYVATLTAECNAKAAEWAERHKTATGEIEALGKAKEILQGKFGSLAQISARGFREGESEEDRRDRLTRVVKKLAREYKSFALMQLAGAAQADPFVKVRGLIEDMIAALEKQAQEEASHNAFCTEETAKTKKKIEVKQGYVDKYSARKDQAEASINTLKGEIATLNKEIAEIEKSVAAATELRTQEKSDFDAAKKDYTESGQAIVQAMQVLKEYYGAGEESFLQTKQAPGVAPEFASSKGESAGMILGILETAESEFSKLLAEAEASESEASNAYEKLMQESKVTKAAKKAEIQGKSSEVKSLHVALEHHAADLETTNKELDALLEYQEKLKPQCENKAMTYEERKARREAEMEGLKEALSILEGDDIAAFIQKKGFLSKK